jgi:tryptophan synthase alpha chain
MSRLAGKFAELRAQNRAAFIPFITCGDPDIASTIALLDGLPGAGADIIELGVPFSDPMADGPVIQASSLRALRAGMSLPRVLDIVTRFRKTNKHTPLVLMGYFNPIHAYGPERFVSDASHAGVDGLITVDLGPEEDSVLRAAAQRGGIDIVRLATPTTNDARLPAVLNGAGGFLYYVAIAGVTGTKSFAEGDVKDALARLRRATALPIAVGFGIKTPQDAAAIARFADGAAVGSSIVNHIAATATAGKAGRILVDDVLGYCRSLAEAVHSARATAKA